MDDLSEKYNSHSPYNYVNNNPIRFIDPDGREIVDPQGRRAIYYDKKGEMYFTKYATETPSKLKIWVNIYVNRIKLSEKIISVVTNNLVIALLSIK